MTYRAAHAHALGDAAANKTRTPVLASVGNDVYSREMHKCTASAGMRTLCQ